MSLKLKEFYDKMSKKQKIWSAIAIALVAVVIIGSLISAVVKMGRTNLIENGSFESWTFGKPSGWSIYNYRQEYEFDSSGVSISKSTAEKTDGKTSLKISIIEENDVRFYQDIKVKGNTYYKISASFKVEGEIEAGYGAGISIYDQKITFSEAHSTNTGGEWVTYTIYGITGEDQESLQLAVGLGGFSATSEGTIWIDNVSVEKLEALPEGVSVYNLFVEDNSEKHNPIIKPWLGKIIFTVFCIATIIFVIALCIKSDKKRGTREEEIAKGEWQPGMKVVSLKEVLLIIVLTVAYLLLALYNLGDMAAPETHYTPEYENRGESVIVSFDEEHTISRIMYNTNLTSLGENTVAYTIEYLNEDGTYETLLQIKESGFYKWFYSDVSAVTKQIRITSDYPGLEINEIGFLEKYTQDGYDEYRVIPAEVSEVVANTVSDTPSTIEQYSLWFDEQDTVVDCPSFMNSTYFDEIYFPRTAYENINNLPVYEITHPPLGKLIQAVGILIFGMNPFGWRIMGTLFGALMIPLMYLIAKKMFNSKFFAFMAAALMLFDTMHFAQTRLATIDSYTVVFIMLMYYFMYDVFICRSYEIKYRQYLIPLALSGLFFGLGAATKWICLYAAFGLAIIFFLSKFLEIYSYRKLAVVKPEVKEEKWYKNYPYDNVGMTICLCFVFFVFIPIFIYCMSYIPYTHVEGANGSLLDVVWSNQKYMYNYHSKLTSPHGYSSEWWSWILDIRPIWYYHGTTAEGLRSTIASFGNPIIWWSGIVALFSSCYIAMKKGDKKIAFVLIGYACQLFPWIIVFRACFIYHYFSCLPFLILFIVYVAKHLTDTKVIRRRTVCIYIAIVAVVFVLFYPAISGMVVPESYIEKLRILPTWWF